jgi:hypothetical protein
MSFPGESPGVTNLMKVPGPPGVTGLYQGDSRRARPLAGHPREA